MKRILMLLFLFGALQLSNAFAHYHPEQGRWLSRDPVNEHGFKSGAQKESNNIGNLLEKQQREWGTDDINKEDMLYKMRNEHNLYNFVFNSPIDFFDALGLEVQICIRPVDRRFPPPSWWLIVHSFIKTDKCGNWGYFPDTARVPNPNVPEVGGVVPEPNPEGTAGQASRCKTVDCPCLDEDKLCEKIAKSKTSGQWDGTDWNRIFHNCAHWTDMILKSQKCKGMEAHFPNYRLPPARPRY